MRLSRCIAFDNWMGMQQQLAMSDSAALRNLGEGVLPYLGFCDRLDRSAAALTSDLLAGLVIAAGTLAGENKQRADEIARASTHLHAVARGLWSIRRRLYKQLKDVEVYQAERSALSSAFRQRLSRYPLTATLDAAVTLEVEDLQEHLTSVVGCNVAEELMSALSFFKGCELRGKWRVL